MSRIISVVTPVHSASVPYLPDAYDSLAAQKLPAGWDWQWVVQEDGETGAIAEVLPDDPRISAGAARSGGPGVARTTALTRVDGEVVKNFDADDKLMAGALARDIEILTNGPDIGWTSSRTLDLFPDGTFKDWGHPYPDEGIIARGSILEYWESHDWMLPIYPTTLCMRRDLLLALGGWMALVTIEDTGLVIAANMVSDGYFIGEPSLFYRRHPEQVTAQGYHNDPAEKEGRRRLIAARAHALGSLFPDGPYVGKK